MSSAKREAIVPEQRARRGAIWRAGFDGCDVYCQWDRRQSTFGSVVGIIQDKSWAMVGGADVSVRGIEDNFVRRGVSDEAGTFKVSRLRPGRYEVFVSRVEV